MRSRAPAGSAGREGAGAPGAARSARRERSRRSWRTAGAQPRPMGRWQWASRPGVQNPLIRAAIADHEARSQSRPERRVFMSVVFDHRLSSSSAEALHRPRSPLSTDWRAGCMGIGATRPRQSANLARSLRAERAAFGDGGSAFAIRANKIAHSRVQTAHDDPQMTSDRHGSVRQAPHSQITCLVRTAPQRCPAVPRTCLTVPGRGSDRLSPSWAA